MHKGESKKIVKFQVNKTLGFRGRDQEGFCFALHRAQAPSICFPICSICFEVHTLNHWALSSQSIANIVQGSNNLTRGRPSGFTRGTLAIKILVLIEISNDDVIPQNIYISIKKSSTFWSGNV